MKSSSVLPCWASTGHTVLEHPEGELAELGEQLDDTGDDEDDGHGLGLDALDHRAPAAGLLLLVGHDFTVCTWLSSDLSQLTCQQQNI